MSDFAASNAEYLQHSLTRANMHADPVEQFRLWFRAAGEAGVLEANAMTLATASQTGVPSARMVLLKSFDANGFVFYTNYESRKAIELVENPNAALVFYWRELERQVRITGTVERVSPVESDAYFRTRPLQSQISAWASPQSQIVPNRDFLEERFTEAHARFEAHAPERPPHWGGFRVKPTQFEFWQGRPSRMHDRFLYRRTTSDWEIVRLAP